MEERLKNINHWIYHLHRVVGNFNDEVYVLTPTKNKITFKKGGINLKDVSSQSKRGIEKDKEMRESERERERERERESEREREGHI